MANDLLKNPWIILVIGVALLFVLPKFSSQTKDRLTKDIASKLVYDSVKPQLDAFFSKNKSFIKTK